MKLNSILTLLGVIALASPSSHAALIAYWNFNGLSTTSGVPSNANQTSYTPTTGSGSLTLAGWTSRAGATAPHGISNFGGSTVNALNSDPSGQSLALQAGTTSGTPNNGATLILNFSTLGLEDVVLSFATQKTSTGFNANQVSYSTDGLAYTDFGSAYNPATSFALQTFDFSAITGLDNKSNVFIKILFSGATNTSGNNRIENVQINAVPEPSGAAILGSIGILGLLRRRR